MLITIKFKDGRVSQFQSRYFTVYPHTAMNAEPEIHIETIDGDNEFFGLSIIEDITGVA